MATIKRIRTLSLCLALAVACPGAWSQGNPLADKQIYVAQDENARRVLENLLAVFGRKLVGDSVPNRPVSGRFEVRNIADAMAYFKSAYQINWFENGTNVYVYRSTDWRTQRIYVGGDRANDEWKELITAAGLQYKEFPVVFVKDQKELVISGPRSYVALVENAFAIPRPDPSEIEKHGVSLMVFPLRHASVEDRQTALRGTLVTTPGALTVMLNLLGLPQQLVGNAPEIRKTGSMVDKRSQNPGADLGNDVERLQALPTSAKSSVPVDKKQEPGENIPQVTADPRTNSILVRDAKSKYNYYKDLIDQLDRPVSMIEVEAMMVEVDQQGLKELGLEFGLINRHLRYEFPGPSVDRTSILNTRIDDPGRVPEGIVPGASSVVDPTRFMARLRALEADENAKVVARPTILTQDNISAYIDLSQTIFLPLAGERVADVAQITAGSLLQVTPRVVLSEGDDRIFLRIEIQDGSLIDDTTYGVRQSARVQNTSLSTQALIPRDKAILVGGYNRDSTQEVDYKVPVLGSLPIIGKAFSSTERTKRTVARVFLITPRLVDRPLQDMPSMRSAASTLEKKFNITGGAFEGTPSLRIDSTLQSPSP